MFLIDENIDWEMLKKQKVTLLEVITFLEVPTNTGFTSSQVDSLLGIIHLIDNVQDNAVKSGKWEEEEVFNLSGE